MDQDNATTKPEPAPDRPLIATFDDDGRACSLEGSGLDLFVNIMRISQHWGRPAFYEDLSEKVQEEVRLWARSSPAEEANPVAHKVRAYCMKMVEDFEDRNGL